MIRQFPFTVTDQRPAIAPLSACQRQPRRFISLGSLAAFRAGLEVIVSLAFLLRGKDVGVLVPNVFAMWLAAIGPPTRYTEVRALVFEILGGRVLVEARSDGSALNIDLAPQ